MTRRARLALSAAACAVGLGLLALPAGAEDTARIADSGWWWRLQAGVLTTLPPPPDVDPGELVVEGTPDGAQAISAISIVLPEDGITPTVTLTVAEGGDQGGEAAVLLACQAGSGWSGAEAARWDTAPVVDCTQSVSGIRSDDGTEWAFPVGPLQFGDKLNVVITPGTVDGAPEGLNGSSFRLVFAPPTPESVTTVSGTPPPLTPLPPPPAAFTGPLDPAGGFDPGSVAAPLVPAQPALEPERQGQTATSPRIQESTQPVVSAAEPEARTLARMIGLLVLLGGFGYGLLTWRQTAAAPAAAHATEGGLSRFRRPRDGDPSPVS
jgi:hypothetical protein